MRVLFYINSLATGGAERTLVKLANTLATASDEVTVATQLDAAHDRFTLAANITRLCTDTGQTSTSLFSALGNNVRRITRLRQLIKQQQPDVVVAFMATANTVATFATLGLNVPVVVSERNYPPALPLSPMHKVAQRLANRWADHMVVLTHQTKQWYQRERGLRALTVIPNGVTYPVAATDTNAVPPDQLLEANKPLVLCVGRINQQKQPELALKAFADASHNNTDWQMAWLGRGNTDHLLAQATQLGIGDRFIAPGAVSNVQDWYERADIYLMTSAYEGFPNSLLEAMACGCACIALDCPTGPADIIRHEDNGLLLPLGQPAVLAANINNLMQDPQQRQALGQAATLIRDQFSDAAAHTAWRKLLQTLVKDAG